MARKKKIITEAYIALGWDPPMHAKEDCQRRTDVPCCYHSPREHKMNTWPIKIRYDKSGLAERICPHGIGHPDPDSLQWVLSRAYDFDLKSLGIHGCDGCCGTDEG